MDRWNNIRWGLLLQPGRGEVEVCQALLSAGYKPVRQYRVGRRFVDIALVDRALAIEIDDRNKQLGKRHRRREARREAELAKHGWSVIRIGSRAAQTTPGLVLGLLEPED
jgi:very-short-patch-repair endonuclease